MSVTLTTIAFKCFEHVCICHNYDVILILITPTVCYSIIITVAVVELMQSIIYEIINYFVQLGTDY